MNVDHSYPPGYGAPTRRPRSRRGGPCRLQLAPFVADGAGRDRLPTRSK